ncbi:MAG: TonB family protein [Nitrospira sp.]
MQAWTSAGMLADDEWQATLTRRLAGAVVVSLVLHVGILAVVGWIRLPQHGERPLASIEISLANLQTPPVKTVEPEKSPPSKKEVERPKPVEQPKPIERSKPAPPVKAAPSPAPPVKAAPIPPPVAPAKPSNDIMRDVMKDIELPPDAPRLGDISPEDKPKKLPAMKLPDVPVVAETREATERKPVVPAPSSSLTEDVAKELDEELKKIRKLEPPKATAPADVPPKPAPQVEAKAVSIKTVDTTLKVPGMAPGSNAYLGLVRQRISGFWSAPPVDVTGQAYVVIVQFRLHRNGSVTGVSIERSSGNEYYDLAGKRAVLNAVPLPVFPPDITDAYFDAHFTFTVGEPQG